MHAKTLGLYALCYLAKSLCGRHVWFHLVLVVWKGFRLQTIPETKWQYVAPSSRLALVVSSGFYKTRSIIRNAYKHYSDQEEGGNLWVTLKCVFYGVKITEE